MTSKAPIIALVGCLLLGLGFYFLAWKPKDEQQTSLENEAADLEDEASRLRNEIAALEQIRDNEAQIRATVDRLRQYVPEGPAQPTAVRQLQQAADNAGVEIISMQFGEPEVLQGAPDPGEPQTVVASINASVNLEGGYFQITDFMRRIETEVPRAVLVSQLSLGEGEEGFPELSGQWSGNLFSIVPATKAQSGDGGSGDGSGSGQGSGDGGSGSGSGDGSGDSGGDGGDQNGGGDNQEGGSDLPEGGDDELQEAAG